LVAHLHFLPTQKPNKKMQKSYQANAQRHCKQWTDKHRQRERQLVTRVWQKWRFSASETHLWLIKVWFSVSTFVVKIATFAKPENVTSKRKGRHDNNKQTTKNEKKVNHFDR
jgi:hypothetical protein